MSKPMAATSDSAKVRQMIDKLPPDSQCRVEAVADLLRSLINQPGNEGHEIELAFTLVLAERAES